MGGAPTHPQQLKPHQRQISSAHHHHHHGRRRRRRRINHFPKGSLVEVQTDEEDFKGVYFSATVILSSPVSQKRGSKKKSKKLYLEYHNLLAHEDGSERLREYVGISFVRPAPPFQEIVKGFEPDDVVDAFYKDGWWIGVVSRVVGGGERFVVTFQYPPDELEFGLAELRAHWDWVDGSWFRTEEQSIAGLMFDVGRKVEVSFDREDCQGAWFPATVHKDLGNGAFLVEYGSENVNNKAQALKVTIDSLHVRPCPPLLKDRNFVLLEKVDAFFDFGWWSGVITKELENSRYIVFFKQLKRDKELSQFELRTHLEWKDGKWFTSPQDISIPSTDDGMHDHHTPENSSGSALAVPVISLDDIKDTCDGKTPSSLNLKKDQFEQLTPVNQKTSHVTTSLTKRRQLSDSRKALSHPSKKLKEGNVLGASQQETHDRSIKETACGSSIPVSVNDSTSSATQTATGDLSDNRSWGKRVRRKQRGVGATRNVVEKVNSISSSMKKSSIQTLLLESPELDVGGKKPDAVGNTAEDVQNESAKKETELPIIIGLPCAEMGSSEFGIARVKRGRRSNIKEIIKLVSDQKQQLSDSTIQKMQDSQQLETGEFSEKKRRGRPRKILVESIQTPEAENAQNGVVGSDDLSRKDGGPHRIPEVVMMGTEASLPNREKMGCKDKLTNGQSDPKTRKGSMMKRTLAKMYDEKVVKEPSKLRENRSLKKGRRRVTGEKIAIQVQDSIDASGGKTMEVNSTVEVEHAVTEAPCKDFDDEPLSKWIEGMHSPSVTDGTRLSPVSTVEQCMENGMKQKDAVVLEGDSGKRPESVMQASALVDKGSIVPSEQQSLPFMKNTVLWKTIESMEVFQRIPQRPHFQPLEHFKESAREGLAIGYMVTFSSLVEKASRLQLNDPKSITDDILETLADLEIHGFDVRVVQDCVTELLAVKDKQGKLVDEVNELNNQILEHSREKSRIDEEIQGINEQILKLQERLSLAESAKEHEDGEIASLQARLQETEESMKNVGREFEGVASSML